MAFAFVLIFFPGLALGNYPTLTLFDSGGTPHTSPDNSTEFAALPGEYFGLQLEDKKDDIFGLYLSLYKTPYPLNEVPPPLLLMPPLFVLEQPGQQLDENGIFNSMYYLPPDLGTLGYDLNIYLQGYTWNQEDSFELSNGITMIVAAAKYRAIINYAWGPDLDIIPEFGTRLDEDATDNQIPASGGGGLENGGKFFPAQLLDGGGVFVLKDQVSPPATKPNPTTSLYLNTTEGLIPGDAGVGKDSRFAYYPPEGSSPHIYSRDRVCRNNENRYLQHIIVPVFDENGEKTQDLNIYHYKYKTLVYDADQGAWVPQYEYGFIALNVLTNEFYELTGTRFLGTQEESAWDPYVAVSPDGKFMSAVLKGTRGDPQVWSQDPDVQWWEGTPDKLYIIRLQKDDLWEKAEGANGKHARFVRSRRLQGYKNASFLIFAESMIFAGKPDPHVLFLLMSRENMTTSASFPPEPPLIKPGTLWRVLCDWDVKDPEKPALVYNFGSSSAPRAGGGQYEINYFGETAHRGDRDLTRLKPIVSKDHSILCIRGAGRSWDDNANDPDGRYAFDIIAFKDITYSKDDPSNMDFEVTNITQFSETGQKQGFFIMPFGHARCGFMKAALSEPNIGGIRFMAFSARSYTSAHQPGAPSPTNTSEYESDQAADDLYIAPLDGSMAGSLVPLTNPNLFGGNFQSNSAYGSGIYDPYFADPDSLLFFCGQHSQVASNSYNPPTTDLFLYKVTDGTYRNLTVSGWDNGDGVYVKEVDPPYNYFGTVRPSGLFSSSDGRYIFFLRAWSGSPSPPEDKRVNIVGIDTQNDFTLFDVSGPEFSQGIWPEMDYEKNGDHVWGAEALNMIIMPGASTDKLFFTAKYLEGTKDNYQVFGVNLDLPTGVYPLTFFDSAGMIDNMVCDPSMNYVAFARSDRIYRDWSEGAFEDIYIVDINQGFFMKNLTESYPEATRASVDGSFRFISSPLPSIPTQFIYGMGQGGGNVVNANNPPQARIWLYPIGADSNHSMPSYPLTEESRIMLFNVLPWE